MPSLARLSSSMTMLLMAISARRLLGLPQDQVILKLCVRCEDILILCAMNPSLHTVSIGLGYTMISSHIQTSHSIGRYGCRT